MSIEINKNDFEAALKEMKGEIKSLDAVIDAGIMETLNAVINEYESHYQSDIEYMINENESMKEQIES